MIDSVIFGGVSNLSCTLRSTDDCIELAAATRAMSVRGCRTASVDDRHAVSYSGSSAVNRACLTRVPDSTLRSGTTRPRPHSSDTSKCGAEACQSRRILAATFAGQRRTGPPARTLASRECGAVGDPPAGRRLERRSITIMFCDMSARRPCRSPRSRGTRRNPARVSRNLRDHRVAASAASSRATSATACSSISVIHSRTTTTRCARCEVRLADPRRDDQFSARFAELAGGPISGPHRDSLGRGDRRRIRVGGAARAGRGGRRNAQHRGPPPGQAGADEIVVSQATLVSSRDGSSSRRCRTCSSRAWHRPCPRIALARRPIDPSEGRARLLRRRNPGPRGRTRALAQAMETRAGGDGQVALWRRSRHRQDPAAADARGTRRGRGARDPDANVRRISPIRPFSRSSISSGASSACAAAPGRDRGGARRSAASRAQCPSDALPAVMAASLRGPRPSRVSPETSPPRCATSSWSGSSLDRRRGTAAHPRRRGPALGGRVDARLPAPAASTRSRRCACSRCFPFARISGRRGRYVRMSFISRSADSRRPTWSRS